jgi:hypothetical protein
MKGKNIGGVSTSSSTPSIFMVPREKDERDDPIRMIKKTVSTKHLWMEYAS